MSSHHVLNLCISIMESCTFLPPRCFSNPEDVTITREFFDHLYTYTYDGEGEVAWHDFLHDYICMLHEEDGCSNEQASLFLAYKLCESPHRWLCSLPANRVHSLEHLCDLIEDTFYHFDSEHLDQKLQQQRKTLHESPMDFWQRFCILQFQAPKSQINFFYLWD